MTTTGEAYVPRWIGPYVSAAVRQRVLDLPTGHLITAMWAHHDRVITLRSRRSIPLNDTSPLACLHGAECRPTVIGHTVPR